MFCFLKICLQVHYLDERVHFQALLIPSLIIKLPHLLIIWLTLFRALLFLNLKQLYLIFFWGLLHLCLIILMNFISLKVSLWFSHLLLNIFTFPFVPHQLAILFYLPFSFLKNLIELKEAYFLTFIPQKYSWAFELQYLHFIQPFALLNHLILLQSMWSPSFSFYVFVFLLILKKLHKQFLLKVFVLNRDRILHQSHHQEENHGEWPNAIDFYAVYPWSLEL